MILLFLACNGGEDSEVAPPHPEREELDLAFVLSSIVFTRRNDEGQVWGFDLDEHDSKTPDAAGCNHADYRDPDGNSGIDNAFASLIPSYSEQVPNPTTDDQLDMFEYLLSTQIADGKTLVTVEMKGTDPSCLKVVVGRAVGPILTDTNGLILDGQSLRRDATARPVSLSCVPLVQNTIRTSRFDTSLVLTALPGHASAVLIHPNDARLRFSLSEDRYSGWGYLSGSLIREEAEALLSTYQSINGHTVATIEPEVALAVEEAADLATKQAGPCSALSVGFDVQAVQVFLED